MSELKAAANAVLASYLTAGPGIGPDDDMRREPVSQTLRLAQWPGGLSEEPRFEDNA